MTQVWQGIHKLVEECGEVLQIAGKLGPYPVGPHPDGAGPLRERLEDELADLAAAIHYVSDTNGLDLDRMMERTRVKLAKFKQWGLTGLCAEVEQA